MSLSRAQIMAAPVQVIELDVPELGGTVRVRALTAKTRVELLDVISQNARDIADYDNDQMLDEGERAGFTNPKRYDTVRLELIWSLVDGDNQPLFTLDDHDYFDNMAYPTMAYLYSAVAQLRTRANVEALKKSSS